MASRHIVTTKIAKGWGVGQWQSAIKHAVPSGEGKVGVIFCWCSFPGSDGPNYGELSSADFVIKPSPGPASPSTFAETFLKQTVGALSVNTHVIPKTDPRFKAVLAALEPHKRRAEASVADLKAMLDTYKRDLEILLDRLSQGLGLDDPVPLAPTYRVSPSAARDAELWHLRWRNYADAEALMIQDMASDFLDFDKEKLKETQGHGLEWMLKDRMLLHNLGMLFAADAVLGNGDRLCTFNPGNILYDKWTGKIWAIDSATILVNYDRLVKDYVETIKGQGLTVGNWVDQIVLPNTGQQTPMPDQMSAPAFGMNRFFNVDTWWIGFVLALKTSMIKLGRQLPIPDESVFASARIPFDHGVQEGLRAVDAQLSGISWLKVKKSFQDHQKKYGASPDLDWTNFKLRRLYIKSVLAAQKKYGKSMTPEQRQLAESTALAAVQTYANKKYGPNVH